jgi:hypothetical protein
MKMAVAGVLIILLALFGIILPFVGPLFGFGMGPDPAWVVTTSRVVRHIIPGIAVILGGLMLFSHSRAYRGVGIALALLGGIWFTVAPVVLGRVTGGPPALIDMLRPLAYHYGTGLLITALAAFALGRMSGKRAAGKS